MSILKKFINYIKNPPQEALNLKTLSILNKNGERESILNSEVFFEVVDMILKNQISFDENILDDLIKIAKNNNKPFSEFNFLYKQGASYRRDNILGFFSYIEKEIKEKNNISKEKVYDLLYNMINKELMTKNETISDDLFKKTIDSLFLSLINNKKDLEEYILFIENSPYYKIPDPHFFNTLYKKLPLEEKDEYIKTIFNDYKIVFPFDFSENLIDEYVLSLKDMDRRDLIIEKLLKDSSFLNKNLLEKLKDNLSFKFYGEEYEYLNISFINTVTKKDVDVNRICNFYKESYDYISNNSLSKISVDKGLSYDELKNLNIPSEALKALIEKISQKESITKNSILKFIILNHVKDNDLNLLIKEKYYPYFKKEIDLAFEEFDYNVADENHLNDILKYFNFYLNNSPDTFKNEKFIDEVFRGENLFNGDLKINKNKIDILTNFIKDNPEYISLIVPNMFKYIHFYKKNYNSGLHFADDENKESLQLYFIEKLNTISKLIDINNFTKITEKMNKYPTEILDNFSKIFSNIEKKTILKTISQESEFEMFEDKKIMKRKRL